MLTLNFSNRVTFNVNVHGTSSTPIVRCVVGEHPAMVFNATKLQESQYEAIIDLPSATMRAGSHPFKVEVLLNGRLFTPINMAISVEGGFGHMVSDERAAELTPAPVQPLENVLKNAAKAKDIPPAASVAPIPKMESLLKKVDETAPFKKTKAVRDPKLAPKPAMSALESVAKAPVEKRKKVTVSHTLAPAQPLKKCSMKDVANEAAERDQTTTIEHAPTVVVEQVTSIPISLTRGDIVYK